MGAPYIYDISRLRVKVEINLCNSTPCPLGLVREIKPVFSPFCRVFLAVTTQCKSSYNLVGNGNLSLTDGFVGSEDTE